MAWQRLAATLLFAAAPVAAQERGIDERIQDAVTPYTQAFTDLIFSAFSIGDTRVPVILLWLIALAVFCTLYFGFINFRGFRHGFRLLRGDYTDPKSKGDVSHFQALATALSGTVGLGNIAAAVIGFLTLLVAHNLSLEGDTFIVLQAVLDTQIWLATHVVTVNLGYGATVVAGMFGALYILMAHVFPILDENARRQLTRSRALAGACMCGAARC